MLDIRKGNKMTRREFGKGLAAIIGAGVAPSIALGATRIVSRTPVLAGSANVSVGRGMMRNVGGKLSCVFNSEKPKPYDEELNYLESSGTQYIDTGVKGRFRTEVFCEAMLIRQISSLNSIFGSRLDYLKQQYYVVFHTNGRTLVYRQNIPAEGYYGIPNLNEKFELSLTQKNLRLTGAGLDVDVGLSVVTSGWETPTNIVMFGYMNNTRFEQPFYGRIYSFKISENGELIRDFIPVKRGNDVFMFDRCGSICTLTGDSCYPNAGSGSFNWG